MFKLFRTTALGAVQGAGLACILLAVCTLLSPYFGPSRTNAGSHAVFDQLDTAADSLGSNVFEVLDDLKEMHSVIFSLKKDAPSRIRSLYPDLHDKIVPFTKTFAAFAVASAAIHLALVILAIVLTTGVADHIQSLKYLLFGTSILGWVSTLIAGIFGFVAVNLTNELYEDLANAESVHTGVAIAPRVIFAGTAVISTLAGSACSLVAVVASIIATFGSHHEESQTDDAKKPEAQQPPKAAVIAPKFKFAGNNAVTSSPN